MATIEIRGIDELNRKLDRAARNQVLEPPMQRSVLRLQRDMAEYPPQSPASSYERKGTLGRRWTTRVSKRRGGLEGRVGNNTIYAPWVQSDRFQAGMHRGRWQTDRMVIDDNRTYIVGDFERAIARALR